MKKFAVLLASVALLSMMAVAQMSGKSSMGQMSGKSSMSGSEKQAVEKLEDQTRQAALKGDAAFFQKTTADDYVSITGNGKEWSKTDLINALKSGQLKYDAIDVKDRQVRVYGNTAIMNATADVKVNMNGQQMSGTYRATRVWVKKNGKWQVESFQATKEMQPQQAESK